MKADPVMLGKKRAGLLSPMDERARAIINKMGIGECVLVDIRRVRNPKLHRKFFALMNMAFDNWDAPEADFCDVRAEKNFDQFRKDLTVAAGFYDVVLGLNGEARLEAKSIAWANMGEEQFTPLYEAVLGVLARGFLPGVTSAMVDQFANSTGNGF